MTTRIKATMNLKWVLPILFACVMVTSCKNKKKATEVSDTAQVQKEIEEEIAAYEEEETPEPTVNLTSSEQLNKYMNAIAMSSTTTEANNNIREALTMFSSPDAAVLIEIYRGADAIDYDEPTTASKYLNYLKDQKKSPAKVQDIVLDNQGRIKELVLRRSYQ